MLLKASSSVGSSTGSLTLCSSQRRFLSAYGTLCRKCGLALVEAAEPVSAQRLHDADVDESVVVAQKFFAIEADVFRQLVEVVVEQLLAEFGRQVGFRIVEQRGDVVLQRAFASALVVDEIGLAVDQHYVAGLEVAVEKVILRRAEQEFREAVEIVFERLLAEGNSGKAQEVVLEIVQIPGDGLAVETAAGIADRVVEVAGGVDLKARQHGDHFAIGLDDGRRDDFAGPIALQKVE